MTSKVCVGVIGTSGFDDISHLPGLKSHPGADLVAICGRNQTRAGEMAGKYDIPQVYADYRKMIAEAGLDAIVIASPDDLHYQMAMDALDAGLHVICEKPLALTAEHAREMYEKAEAAGVTHMTYFTFRGVPAMQRARMLFDQGYVGRIRSCEFHYLFAENPDPSYRWRSDPARCHGVLSRTGSHMIDMARWLVGEITAVSAHLSTFGNYLDQDGKPMQGTNDDAVLLVQFANGAHGTIHLSIVANQGARAQQQRYAFFGDAGTLEIEVPFFGSAMSGAVFRGVRAGEPAFVNLPISDDAARDALCHQGLIAYFLDDIKTQPIGDRMFIDAVIAGEKVTPSLYDGWKAQQVIDAALKSHETGCWARVQ